MRFEDYHNLNSDRREDGLSNTEAEGKKWLIRKSYICYDDDRISLLMEEFNEKKKNITGINYY